MIYEWRTYEAMPGKLLALNTHLKVAADLFKKHTLGVLGFWTDEIGTGGQITYMWTYADLEDRQKKVAAFAVARTPDQDERPGVARLRGDAGETARPPRPLRQPYPPSL